MDKEYFIRLSTFPAFGPARLKLLLSYFESAKNVWNAKEHALSELGLKKELLDKFLHHRAKFDFDQYKKNLERHEISIVTIFETGYPENLKTISDAPYVLYIKGSVLKKDSLGIGVVGSRKMTTYGKDVCETIVSSLCRSGITIISGLARGIDTTAHKTALKNGGRTIAVMAGGLDTIYPPENRYLVPEVTKHGALISEYPLGYPYLTTSFPHRNRIISGLSKGVLIVEAQKKSGTLWTATHAVNQNRQVFAIPGNITSLTSEAPNYLIQEGAKMVLTPEDIIHELGVDGKPVLQDTLFPMDETEARFLSSLEQEPMHLDELARITAVPIAEVSAKLMVMELKGAVKHLGGGVYKRV